ncbi:hypothetical protein HDU80_006383 [Chytriomyces hyalinus]|nr:hypothetical protein HDU80_006383 [Chytriomyces hyalinus]
MESAFQRLVIVEEEIKDLINQKAAFGPEGSKYLPHKKQRDLLRIEMLLTEARANQVFYQDLIKLALSDELQYILNFFMEMNYQ